MKSMMILFLLLLLPLSGAIAQDLPTLRGPQYNARASQGSFDLVVWVDGEAMLYAKDSGLRAQVISGQPAQNAGSTFSQPIPHAVFSTFNVQKIAGRGTVTVVEEPTAANNYTAAIRVNDKSAGRDLYHIRLSWTWDPSNPNGFDVFGSAGRPYDRFDPNLDRPNFGGRDRVYDNRFQDGEFQFSGYVNGVKVLRLVGSQMYIQNVSGLAMRNPTYRFSRSLPYADLRNVNLTNVTGRGRVELVERPWEGNDYATVVRITDNNSRSSGQYSFRLTWQEW